MKLLLRIVGVLVVLAAIALVVLRIAGLDPQERRPGLWLTGNLVTTPITDWTFSDKYPIIMIQTNPWYMIPHSVTITCVSHNGQLYLNSVFPQGMPFPDGKGWTKGLTRDPNLRLKIGNNLYDRTAVHLTDAAEIAAVEAAKLRKFPDVKVPKTSTTYWFHVM